MCLESVGWVGRWVYVWVGWVAAWVWQDWCWVAAWVWQDWCWVPPVAWTGHPQTGGCLLYPPPILVLDSRPAEAGCPLLFCVSQHAPGWWRMKRQCPYVPVSLELPVSSAAPHRRVPLTGSSAMVDREPCLEQHLSGDCSSCSGGEAVRHYTSGRKASAATSVCVHQQWEVAVFGTSRGCIAGVLARSAVTLDRPEP